MKQELQEKYKGWFCWFLQRKMDALAFHKTLYGTRAVCPLYFLLFFARHLRYKGCARL
jgi:hypothetical protein